MSIKQMSKLLIQTRLPFKNNVNQGKALNSAFPFDKQRIFTILIGHNSLKIMTS